MLRPSAAKGAGKPVRVRRGRATVIGTSVPGARTPSLRGPHRRDASSQRRSVDRSPKARRRRLMRRLVLVRHGSTAAVRAAAFGADEPLDESGVRGAARLRSRLPGRFDSLLVSPARRALQTAAGPGSAPGGPALGGGAFGA